MKTNARDHRRRIIDGASDLIHSLSAYNFKRLAGSFTSLASSLSILFWVILGNLGEGFSGLRRILIIACLVILRFLKFLLERWQRILLKMLAFASMIIVAYVEEITFYWSSCAHLGKKSLLLHRRIQVVLQGYEKHWWSRIQDQIPRPEVESFTVFLLLLGKLFALLVGWLSWLILTVVMTLSLITIVLLPVSTSLRSLPFSKWFFIKRRNSKMDYLSGVQEYIDIESIINPGRAGNKPCGNKALVMKRGIWRQQVSEPGGRLRPMQSKVLIVRYGYAYDNVGIDA
jgi:hypothetical protein